jgi:FkbM family methyltransferase
MDVFIDPSFYSYYKQNKLKLADIGASGGLQDNWVPAESHLQVIGFEPDEREYVNLIKNNKNENVVFLNAALYKERTTLDFHLAKKQMVSSIFKPNRSFLDEFPEADRFDIEETVKIDVDTLENQFRKHNIADLDFIKVDTQGSELFVLEGATEILKKDVFGLEIEVEFAPMYVDQPLFADVDQFVKQLGFQLFDLKPYFWKRNSGKKYGNPKGQLIFADALYFKTQEALSNILNKNQDDDWIRSKVLRSIAICILYGYLDYAMDIFNKNICLFSKIERKVFITNVQNSISISNKIPTFKGRSRLVNLIHRLSKIFEVSDWVTNQQKLGNLGGRRF